jgi:hypothetical protein
VVPLPHICQLALPSTSTSCHILFLSVPASCCVVSHQPATLQLPYSIASPTHGWLLCLLPAPLSLIVVVWPLLTLDRCLLFCFSQASCLADCCITSLSFGWMLHCLSSHHHLPSASNSASHCAVSSCHALSIPSPIMPLVWLVILLPLLTLPPPICQHLCLS